MRIGIVGLALALSLTACGHGGHEAAPGDVTLLWHFSDGNTCDSAGPYAATIEVSIPGEALANGGDYPCQSAGTDGITLDNFAPGTYDFSITAFDLNGAPTYTQSGTFLVDGDITVDVTLDPASVVQN